MPHGSYAKTGNGTVRSLIVKVSSFLEKELKKCNHSAKVTAKSAITEKRQGKRRGGSAKKELKKCYQNRKMIAESAIKIEIFYHILSSLSISAGF